MIRICPFCSDVDIEELKEVFNGDDVPFEKVEEIVSDDVFSGASKLGIDYAKGAGFESFEDAPFCLEKVTPGTAGVIVDDCWKYVPHEESLNEYEKGNAHCDITIYKEY